MKNTGKTYFKGKSLDPSCKQAAVSVKLPPEIDAKVRSLLNRSNFIREAVSDEVAPLANAKKLVLN